MSDESPSERLRRLQAGLRAEEHVAALEAELTRTREELGEVRRQKERLIKAAHSRDRSWERMRAKLSAAHEELEEARRERDWERAERKQTEEAEAETCRMYHGVKAELSAASEALKGAEELCALATPGWLGAMVGAMSARSTQAASSSVRAERANDCRTAHEVANRIDAVRAALSAPRLARVVTHTDLNT